MVVFGHMIGQLIIVDERPEEVTVYELTLAQAQAIRDQLQSNRPDVNGPMDRLMLLMMPRAISPVSNSIDPLSENFGHTPVENDLHWFTTKEAELIVKQYVTEIPGLDQLFGFAKALTLGCAFSVASNQVTYFVGWQSKLMVYPGTVLLDATADIDGVSQFVRGESTPRCHRLTMATWKSFMCRSTPKGD